jgi:hypothetical protein
MRITMPTTLTTQSPPASDAVVLRRGVSLLADRLPESWSIRREGDGLTEIAPPTGPAVLLVIEARKVVVARDVPRLIEQLRERVAEIARRRRRTIVPVLIARYVSPPDRERLAAEGIGYVDLTGNIAISADRPPLLLRDAGADSDPWRGRGRPRGSLSGGNALRLARALAENRPPISVPELAERSGVSVSSTYRALDLMADQDLIERAPRGPITRIDWRRILERLGRDSAATANATLELYLAPRGIPAVLERLAESERRYAVSGSVAASAFAPYAESRLLVVYADEPDELAQAVGLRPATGEGNVLLGPPPDDVVYERTLNRDGVTLVAPAQAAIDLMNSPGRGPAEAEALLDWMQENPDEWR